MTDEEMRSALIDRAGLAGEGRMGGGEMETAEEYFPGIFDEDA